MTLSQELRANGLFFAPAGRHGGVDSVVGELGRELRRSHVKPRATTRSLVCSRRGLGPHTDHFRADFIAWECLESAPRGGATFVVHPAPALEALDERNLARAFDDTQGLYEHAFGEPMARVGAHDCWHDCQGRCWHACSDIDPGLSDQRRANVVDA